MLWSDLLPRERCSNLTAFCLSRRPASPRAKDDDGLYRLNAVEERESFLKQHKKRPGVVSDP